MSGTARWLVIGATTGTVLVAVLALTGVSKGVDHATMELFWPGQVWGETQARADTTANLLAPAYLAAAAFLVAGLMSIHRRSLWPMTFVLVTTASASVVVLVGKWATGNLPAADVLTHHVAYPSGHVVAAIVFTGQLVLMSWPRTTPAMWLPSVGFGVLMAWAVQTAALHYVTDVVGGVLVAVAVLAAASTWRLRDLAVSSRCRG